MILCITHSRDTYTIDLVQQRLQQLGHESFRFDSDRFGTTYQLHYRLESDSAHYELRTGSRVIRASNITGVWYRKLWELELPANLDPAYIPAFRKEYRTALHIFLDSLNVPWINPLHTDHATGGNKLRQLAFAQAAGLRVPKTILSNDAAGARSFYDACNGNVVMKLHGALSKTMDGNGAFFPTTRLQQEDIPALSSLAACPMILQENIPKERELRIAYVDGECYTGCLAAPGTTDWRTTLTPWQPFTLPAEIVEKIDRMMRAMRLYFGAIDMILQPDGKYVFLEVNPQGEWGMLQQHLDLPIAAAIADALAYRTEHAKI